MPAYRFEAVDAARQAAARPDRRGDARGRSATSCAREGLFPTVIEAASAADIGGGRRGRRRADRAAAARRAGRAVDAAARDARALGHAARPGAGRGRRAGRRRARGRALRRRCARRSPPGETLAGALARWPRTFSDLYRGLVAVAAETGQLPEVLERLADYLEARQAQKQQFTLALIYPALVTVIALAVIAVLLVYVVPQIVSVYQQSRQTLPWLTQALIAVERIPARDRVDLARRRSPSAVVAFAVANRREAFRARWHARAAARAGRRPARRRRRHRALREHARDPHRQRRAAAALARRRARRRLGAADQGGGRRGGAARPRRACRSRAR